MESISRISSLLETARDLTLEAAQSASAVRGMRMSSGSGSRALPNVQLKKLLDSRNERDVLEGLRRVISMMYRSQPCLPLFSSVIKNVASPSLEIKKLVYIYLLHHAEAEPDLALLSINTIQKSLTDQNPQARAMALKVMSGIRVPVISQIVQLAIKKGCADMSPIVRKAAALAIPKCYRLDPATLPQLLDHLSALLGDKQYYVAGAAVVAFMDVCPERIDLIHQHYRALVRKLVDMDEWAQLATLRLMLHYARRCFPFRIKRFKDGASAFYLDAGNEHNADNDKGNGEEEVRILDPDLELLLNACKLLLQSRNSAVIVAVARCFLYLGTPGHVDLAIGPLVSLLRGAADIQHMALYNIVCVCLVRPSPFVKYVTRFLVSSHDAPAAWRLKLEVLTLVFPHCGMHLKGVILNELEHFSQSHSSARELIRESVRAIGRCAQSDPHTSSRCLRLLLKQVASADGNLVAESLTVIRHLIQQDPAAHTNTVIHLAKNLDSAADPQARATIIWLVGEFAGVDPDNNIAPDVLRILVKGFADESETAKLQIVLLAAKVYVHHLNQRQSAGGATPPAGDSDGHGTHDAPGGEDAHVAVSEKEHPILVLWRYVMLLARYDTSYDLRDRARFYKALLADPSSTQLATLLLLAPKPVPQTPSPSESRKGYVLGTASLVVGGGGDGQEGGPGVGLISGGLNGYEPLPDWVEDGQEPDARLRDEPVGSGAKASGGGGGGASSGLDSSGAAARQIPAGDMLDRALAAKEKAVRGGTPIMGTASTSGLGSASMTRGGSSNGGTGPSSYKEKSLDDWLAEDDTDAVVRKAGGGNGKGGAVGVESDGNASEDDGDEEEEEEEEEDDDEEDDDDEEEEEEEEEDEEEEEEEDQGQDQRLLSGS